MDFQEDSHNYETTQSLGDCQESREKTPIFDFPIETVSELSYYATLLCVEKTLTKLLALVLESYEVYNEKPCMSGVAKIVSDYLRTIAPPVASIPITFIDKKTLLQMTKIAKVNLAIVEAAIKFDDDFTTAAMMLQNEVNNIINHQKPFVA